MRTLPIECSPLLIAAALRDIVHATGMAQIAQAAGLRQESLRRVLSAAGRRRWA